MKNCLPKNKIVNSVQSSVRPKVKEIPSTAISTDVDSSVDNLAAQVLVLDISSQGELKWVALPQMAIVMEESNSDTVPKPVPKRNTFIPKTFSDVSAQTEDCISARVKAECPIKRSQKKRSRGKGRGNRTPNVHLDANGRIRVHDWEELKRIEKHRQLLRRYHFAQYSFFANKSRSITGRTECFSGLMHSMTLHTAIDLCDSIGIIFLPML